MRKKKNLEENNSRIMEAEERTSDLEDRMVEISATEQNKGKKSENNLSTETVKI